MSEITKGHPLCWADLGCGSGVFTEALAGFLPEGSYIKAVDKVEQQLPKIMGNSVNINFEKLDFEKESLSFENLDGIMMANSLHFINDKRSLIMKLEQCCKQNPTFLIVEYEHSIPNPWEPYPITFQKLKNIFADYNYHHIEKIGELKSNYGGMMYACRISKF
ncbi:class I SAM-dependent methyltransferase [Elizabethkingia sp. JS20170427COW]|nr:class I SAM-dependent methyltransferase [Elizabethkingia sp. JS20170427COW]